MDECPTPKIFPLRLEEDLLEELNDLRYLHGMGNWPIKLSNISDHAKMVRECIWLWGANTNSLDMSNHKVEEGLPCSDVYTRGAAGFGFSSLSGSGGNLKTGYMLWILIDENFEGMGHRSAMFSPAFYRTRFYMGRKNNPPINGKPVAVSDYFAVLSAYYTHTDPSLSVLRMNYENFPRPEWIALPPPGYIDYTLVPQVWTFQSPKIDCNNVTYRAYINGTLLQPLDGFQNGGFNDGGDFSTTDGVAFTRTTGYDTGYRYSSSYAVYPYPGSLIRVEVESNGYSWEYETLVVDCEKQPTPEPEPKPAEPPQPNPKPEDPPKPADPPKPNPKPADPPKPNPKPADPPKPNPKPEDPPQPNPKPVEPNPTEHPGSDQSDISQPTEEQNQLDEKKGGKDDNQNNKKSLAIGLGVGIPIVIIVLAVIGVGIFILISKGIIGKGPITPSDEEGIDV